MDTWGGVEPAALEIKSDTAESCGGSLLCRPGLSRSEKFGIFTRTANGRIWEKPPY